MILPDNASSHDDQLLDRIIAEFLRQEAAGVAGRPQEWLERYPQCAAELREFFADCEHVGRLVNGARMDSPGGSSVYDSTGIYDDHSSKEPPRTVDLVPKAPYFAAARYQPVKFHARGGMGEVWVAHDARIGRRVALKKLRSGRSDQQARFLIEAQITGQLEHPCVVPLHDLGTDDSGQSYYVMKFIEGRRLSEAIIEFHRNKRRADWTGEVEFVRLLQIFVDLCHAIAYAHSKGVMHRDIKPDNVMLGPFGETLILDWGLAKVIGQPDRPGNASAGVEIGESSSTRDGAIIGTLTYMSPEAARGTTEEIDHTSDVYLLGSTLYEILTSIPPRRGSSQYEIIELACRRRPDNPRTVDPRIPRALEAVCLKAMAFEKHDRYPTALALAEDMQRYLAGEPPTAYREPAPARLRTGFGGIAEALPAVWSWVVYWFWPRWPGSRTAGPRNWLIASRLARN